MKLFLIRHGESVANAEGVYTGQSDVPLTAKGRAQAAAITPILAAVDFDRVYSSDLSRAVDTQRLALPGREGECSPLLREYDLGTLAGQNIEEMLRRHGNDFEEKGDYTPFGGENTDMVRARVEAFLSRLESEPCENVAVFAHGGVAAVMLGAVLRVSVSESALTCRNCAIHVFEHNGSRWRLFAWNYMLKA